MRIQRDAFKTTCRRGETAPIRSWRQKRGRRSAVFLQMAVPFLNFLHLTMRSRVMKHHAQKSQGHAERNDRGGDKGRGKTKNTAAREDDGKPVSNLLFDWVTTMHCKAKGFQAYDQYI